MKILMALGWLLAMAAGGAAYLLHQGADSRQQAALDAQAQAYQAQLADLRAQLARQQAEAAAQVQRVQDDAAAAQQVLQTELDFQRLPELPLETTFRANQVLYIESRLDEPFSCKVRLARPGTAAAQEIDYSIKSRTYQDLAAMGDWMFHRGDTVEFVKPGFKPRRLTVP